MAGCNDVCAKVLNDLLADCNSKSTGGIIQEIKLVNYCDWVANKQFFTYSTDSSPVCSHTITDFTGTASELNAVTVTGIPSKQLMTAGFSSSEQDTGIFFTHTLQLFSQGMTEASMCNIKSFGNGALVVAIVREKAYGVDGKNVFWVYGDTVGLGMGDITRNSSENAGNILIPLNSKEPDFEPNPPIRLLLADDYVTTLAFFDSL